MHGTEVERHYRDARILPHRRRSDEVLTDLAADCWGTRMRTAMIKLPSLGDEVSLWMDAPPAEVWDLVSDVTRIGEFSPRRSRRSGPAGPPGPRWGLRSPVT